MKSSSGMSQSKSRRTDDVGIRGTGQDRWTTFLPSEERKEGDEKGEEMKVNKRK